MSLARKAHFERKSSNLHKSLLAHAHSTLRRRDPIRGRCVEGSLILGKEHENVQFCSRIEQANKGPRRSFRTRPHSIAPLMERAPGGDGTRHRYNRSPLGIASVLKARLKIGDGTFRRLHFPLCAICLEAVKNIDALLAEVEIDYAPQEQAGVVQCRHRGVLPELSERNRLLERNLSQTWSKMWGQNRRRRTRYREANDVPDANPKSR